MTKRRITNVPASVRSRLQTLAQTSGRPFQEVLQYFAMERLLYRLGESPHAQRFILKGALMFTAWRAPTSRPTKDIDLLGHMENRIDEVADAIRDVCRETVPPDGLVFDPDSVKGTIIKEEADYEGVRITFQGFLQNARIPMQIDIGFGDVIVPGPQMAEYPTLLDHAVPRLRGYSRESVVAEKFEAMVKLGLLNSRMKDFYDIWLLSRLFSFDGPTLVSAIQQTFQHRGTQVIGQPTAFSAAFANDPAKITQWQGFLRKTRLSNVPTDLAEVTRTIEFFLSPPATAIADGQPFNDSWPALGPWQAPQK